MSNEEKLRKQLLNRVFSAVMGGGSADQGDLEKTFATDFAYSMVILFLARLCAEGENPHSTAVELVAHWRDRVTGYYALQKEQVQRVLDSDEGIMLKIMGADPNNMDEKFFEALREFTAKTERALTESIDKLLSLKDPE